MKTITLDVCTGVGDIFWVYQKFAPHFDKINFNICRTLGLEEEKVQNRAVPFLKLLPKVDNVGTHDINSWAYTKLVIRDYNMSEVIEKAKEQGHTYYSCNKPLEHKIRLEDIDPDYAVEETVEIMSEPINVPDEYVCLYISGNTWVERCMPEVWTLEYWVDFADMFCKKFAAGLPIVMVGASYDEVVQRAAKQSLEDLGYDCKLFVDQNPAQVIHILNNAKYFICHASGLGILADNLDTKQIMVYPKAIEGLLYSWCKNRNLDNKIYNAALFESSPEEVIEKLEFD